MQENVQENYGLLQTAAECKARKMRLYIFFAAGMAGLLFGLDQGVISGALPFITQEWQRSCRQSLAENVVWCWGQVYLLLVRLVQDWHQVQIY